MNVLEQKIGKNVYPCKPQFYCIKVGCKGVNITRTYFMMARTLTGSMLICVIDVCKCHSADQLTLFCLCKLKSISRRTIEKIGNLLQSHNAINGRRKSKMLLTIDRRIRIKSVVGDHSDKRKIFCNIMQTSPCNEYPLTPYFYIVNLGFTGVYLIFLVLL